MAVPSPMEEGHALKNPPRSPVSILASGDGIRDFHDDFHQKTEPFNNLCGLRMEVQLRRV
ncbi:hypothetical protein PG996_007230 [Apiospora saccharicola]|uniref:Uncharacterized protein n=1 Tax=Apiospora saccharicola TaxID=335842 RepID=A0ABR1VDW6_9PEZI